MAETVRQWPLRGTAVHASGKIEKFELRDALRSEAKGERWAFD